MELNKVELCAVRDVAKNYEEVMVDLTDLELVMIGGGTGDVHFG